MASTVPAPEELLDEPLHGEQHLLGVGGAGAGVHPGGVGRMGEGQRVPQGPEAAGVAAKLGLRAATADPGGVLLEPAKNNLKHFISNTVQRMIVHGYRYYSKGRYRNKRLK